VALTAVRRIFVAGSIAWAAALPLATLAAARAAASPLMSLFALAVYASAAVVCHQRPERSFFIGSHQMPVCARCTGIYVGAAVAVIVVAFRRGRPMCRPDGASRGADTQVRPYILFALTPTVATLAYEWTTGVTPANWIRAASGLCLGAAVAALIRREVN
jgi:Predicted membrane protein (DUF2085)